jgi:hypothetical protein
MERSFCFRLKVMTALLSMVFAGCMVAQVAPKAGARTAPPVWTPSYNSDQGPLPDTSNWKVIHQDRSLVVRVAPGSDWNQYREVLPGAVRYTGSEIKLKPRQIAEITDLLETRMIKDFKGVKLTPAPGASGVLTVDANITDAMANSRANLPAMTVDLVPAKRGRSTVTAWVFDRSTKQPVASIEMGEGDQSFEFLWGLRETGRIRRALRAQSRTLAGVLNQMGPTLTKQAKASAK